MNTKWITRIIAMFLAAVLFLGLIITPVLAAESASLGIIGGADGPTAIFVSGNWGGLVAIVAAVLCSGMALIVALKNRKK